MDTHTHSDPAGCAARASGWSRLLRGALLLCAALLFALAFSISVDVAYRWFAGRSIVGVYEYSEVLLVALSFLAFAGVQGSGRQLNVDILTSVVRGRRKRGALSALDALAALVFFLVLAWTAGLDFGEAYELGLMGNGIVQIPMVLPLGLVVLGSLMMLITLAGQLRGALACLFGRDGRAPEAPAPRMDDGAGS